jgi:AraC-like DNA-binding protein
MRATGFVESYFNAWNKRDPKGIADHLSEDGLYRDVPENSLRSPDELIFSLQEFFTHYRHHYELIGEIQKSENTIAFQYRMFPAPNDRVSVTADSFHGAEFMTLLGDAALAITDYYQIPPRKQVDKYAKSGLTEEQLSQHKERLDRIVQAQKAYLQPDLSLPKLAEEVGCSVNNLSQVINAGFGTSFFDYLNRYRINHAKELLAQESRHGGAILNIAFEVGFNSNSAFYCAFKKHVGQTPAQFRRSKREH